MRNINKNFQKILPLLEEDVKQRHSFRKSNIFLKYLENTPISLAVNIMTFKKRVKDSFQD